MYVVGSSGITCGKQNLSISFNFDKEDIIDCTRLFLIVIHKYTSSLIFFSGFGVTELCWFSNKMALLVYFAVPFAGVMGLNIFLFVFSACMVYDSTKATSKMTTCGPRNNFHLYLRYEYLHFRVKTCKMIITRHNQSGTLSY
jgi:hypothetical protein